MSVITVRSFVYVPQQSKDAAVLQAVDLRSSSNLNTPSSEVH